MIEDEQQEESEQGHHLVRELRSIVIRFLLGEENDKREMEEVVNQADAWIMAWWDRRTKHETVREVLDRLGYLRDVMADAGREFVDQPDHLVAFIQSLEWPTHLGSGQVMRRMIEIFDVYARMVRRATGEPVIVGDLVESLLTRVVPRESAL